jgi:uncharacterized protein YjcR
MPRVLVFRIRWQEIRQKGRLFQTVFVVARTVTANARFSRGFRQYPVRMNTEIKPAMSNRKLARTLYFMGWRQTHIAEHLSENYLNICRWKKEDKWDESTPLDRVEATLEARMVMLIAKEQKEGCDYKEIDLLGRQMERMARIGKYNDTGKESDLNPKILARNEAPRRGSRKSSRNDIGEEGLVTLQDAFDSSLFDYQRHWRRMFDEQRIRNILKSRQIGATWYFAREAVVDAFTTGKNKVFISASKAQAHIFRNYIVQFVLEHTGVELKGDPIVLQNGASLYFLSTNAKTAQGYHGDIYLDEYFWIARFQEFRKVISGMAMHKQWRQTYFSTPSTLAHEAYPFWSGEMFNRKVKREQRIEIDVSHEALARGMVCGDGQWRQIVTVEDAVRGGCDLFDIDQLRLEYSEEEFNNLLMCQFMDDTLSVFPLSKLQGCMVDSWLAWRDMKPLSPRPMGEAEVWLGYDPSGANENGDGAGLIAVAAAKTREQKHRVIEKRKLFGMDYEQQAEEILRWCSRYRVTYIGIDVTGIGDSVASILEKKKPFVKRFLYSPDVKFRLVTRTLNIIDRSRLEFDSGDIDLAQSFMAVRRQLTESGRHVTYSAGRTKQTGHAELAWATMHALANEPIDGPGEGTSQSMLEFYS